MQTACVQWYNAYMDIKNRIVGTGEESLTNILFNPSNWRIHPKYQQDALLNVLEQVGWVQSVIVNRTTGNLVDGHLRCLLAQRNDLETIPVTYVELTQEEEELILATFDPISAFAAADKQKLSELLHAVEASNEDMGGLMDEIREKESIAKEELMEGVPEESETKNTKQYCFYLSDDERSYLDDRLEQMIDEEGLCDEEKLPVFQRAKALMLLVERSV